MKDYIYIHSGYHNYLYTTRGEIPSIEELAS